MCFPDGVDEDFLCKLGAQFDAAGAHAVSRWESAKQRHVGCWFVAFLEYDAVRSLMTSNWFLRSFFCLYRLDPTIDLFQTNSFYVFLARKPTKRFVSDWCRWNSSMLSFAEGVWKICNRRWVEFWQFRKQKQIHCFLVSFFMTLEGSQVTQTLVPKLDRTSLGLP